MSGGAFTCKEAESFAFGIFERNGLFAEYGIGYDKDASTDDGIFRSDIRHPAGSKHPADMIAVIGIKSLYANADANGYATDRDFVHAIFQAYHESVHAWQHCVGFMQADAGKSSMLREAAKDCAIGRCFKPYYKALYELNSMEIHANMHATVLTSKFFADMSAKDARFAAIDADGILRDLAMERYGAVNPRFAYCRTAGDIEAEYSRFAVKAAHAPKFSVAHIDKAYREGLADGSCERCPEWEKLLGDKRFILRASSIADGVAQSDAVCAYIGKRYPHYFRDLLNVRNDFCKTLAGAVDSIASAKAGITPNPWIDLKNAAEGAWSGDQDADKDATDTTGNP